MLSEFKDKQFLAYNLLVKDIENNCVTHAYLIDENNYVDSFRFVLSFVKSILCEKKCVNKCEFCNECSLCKRIDDGNYPELKVISADGMYIKKQQIIELQQEFSRSAVEGRKRVYIIKDCEKMRAEAANSMLKFLEEPEDDIVAILMTNNINNVLSTIISRCKVVKLNGVLNENNYAVSEILENLAIDFVYGLETASVDTFVNIKDILLSKVNMKDRDSMVVLIDIMIDIYYDIMKVLICNENIKYLKWREKIDCLVKASNVDDILRKIDFLINVKDSIRYNVNCNLLIDSIIICIGGIADVSRY